MSTEAVGAGARARASTEMELRTTTVGSTSFGCMSTRRVEEWAGFGEQVYSDCSSWFLT